ncbi:MAG: purine-nucleoside phosphorylase [Solirubrobacteraceae bacterium]|nr:purine-nucleoside phosphorylase [Solirubrobacteraceae bacterium]
MLAPDDPASALRLAQALMVETPKMLNHNRGLWGYSGLAADGELLTVQATGTGGPSAAIVVRELAALGARRIVRVGTCQAAALAPGTVVVADPVVGRDGTSAALGGALVIDEALAGRIDAPRVAVVSVDVFGPGEGVFDMESAAVLAAAFLAGVSAAVVLVVSNADDAQRQLDELAAGAAAARAFSLGAGS